MTNATHASFVALCNAVADDQVISITRALNAELVERYEYEMRKNADNDKIQKTLLSVNNALVKSSSARLHAVANIDARYINRAERVNAKYNVYALQKIADIINVVMHDKKMNAINYHALRSLFNFERKSKLFTHADAIASASNKITVQDASKRQLLSRHTVSASTANTQASSTMNALVTLNVVRETTNENNEKHYELTHSALCEALREIVMQRSALAD